MLYRYLALLTLVLTLTGYARAARPTQADIADIYYTVSLRCDTVHHYYVYWVQEFDPDIYPYFPIRAYPEYAGGYC